MSSPSPKGPSCQFLYEISLSKIKPYNNWIELISLAFAQFRRYLPKTLPSKSIGEHRYRDETSARSPVSPIERCRKKRNCAARASASISSRFTEFILFRTCESVLPLSSALNYLMVW
ncbi:uncharacterized protein LOC143205039 [Rhynchophorus ferrugineus]